MHGHEYAVRFVAAVALLAGGCGGGSAWKPAPASALPIATADPPWAAPAGAARPAAPPPAPVAAPRPAGPSPVSGELPRDLAAPLAASATCKDPRCTLPGIYPPSPAIDGKAPAAVWSHDLSGKGSAVSFPRHAGVDVYGVVLEGAVTVKGAGEGEEPSACARWGALRAPGAGVTVTASEGRARVAFAAVTSGEPIAEAVVQLRGKGAAKLEWKKRPSPIELVDLAGSKDLSWGGGAMHARIGFEGERQRASLGVLIASSDAPVAQHQHDGSWEILVALRASGTARRAERAGGGELAAVPVTDGAIVAIPKGAQHAWAPDGSQPLVALQLYVPPGPEQRFKKLAAEAQPPRDQK